VTFLFTDIEGSTHMIAYTHPDVVAAQIRQAATSTVR
jgi:hypothetical protein